jgi:hypothetical protein
VLRRIFGSKREEVVGGCRRLNNEELHNLYASPNIRVMKSRKMGWVGHVAHMGEMGLAYKHLVGKPEGKRPLVRPGHRWDGVSYNFFCINISNTYKLTLVNFLCLLCHHVFTYQCRKSV